MISLRSSGRPRRRLAANFLQAPVAMAKNAGSGSPQRRHKPDYWLLILAALLLTIGLVVVYSISPGLAASQHISQNYFVTKQLIDVALGGLVFVVAAYLPLGYWKKLAGPLMVVALLASVIVMLSPLNAAYPAHRWIRLGSFSFQVAELIKLALIIGLAKFLTEKWQKGALAESKTLWPLVGLLLGLGVVVAKFQSDLGSAGVMIAIMGAMAFTVGIPLKKVALISALVVVLVLMAVSTSNYRRDRLATFFHPNQNCQGTAYQACQSLISVGSGGIFGLGLGYSVQAYGYQPQAANDSIFAIMAEKFGFFGTTTIIVIYAVFITRLKKIIAATANQFSRLLVVGVLAWLSTQMIINIGAMIGLLPLKGITLPLISQGGTSLIFLTAALGLVFQVSRYTSYGATEPKISTDEAANYYRFNGRGVRRSYNSVTFARPRT